MGLVFCDGFDSYGASADLARNWTGNTVSGWTWNSTAGRLGGGGIQAASVASPALWTPNLFAVDSTHHIGTCFWFKGSAAPSSNSGFLLKWTLSDKITGAGSWISIVATTGVLQLHNGNGSALSVSGGTNVCDNNWHWIEIYTTNNTGTQKCLVDGTTQWNGSFNAGFNGTAVYAILGATSSATNTYTIDDFITFEDQSGSISPLPADIPLGTRQINTVRPASDSSIQFTPTGTGSGNWGRVADVAADDDTSYVQDNVSGHADEYNFGALGFTPATVTAVQLVSRAENPSGGSISFKLRCHSGATVNDSSAIAAGATYSNYRANYNQDPNTSAAWTPTNLASAKFGIVVA